jgi:DNA-binding HxlR family transcriptional regulator
MKSCPIDAIHPLFGRKWTLAILRDVVYFRRARFAQFLRANPGLTDRVLARRLNELVREGILHREGNGKAVRYSLTPRGQDTEPILAALYNYGIRHHADKVFADARPRALAGVLPEWDQGFLASIFRIDEEPKPILAAAANRPAPPATVWGLEGPAP